MNLPIEQGESTLDIGTAAPKTPSAANIQGQKGSKINNNTVHDDHPTQAKTNRNVD